MTATAQRAAKARLEARIDPELDALIAEAAQHLHISKTAFIVDSLREAALKVRTRADVVMMAPRVFDAMIESLDHADPSPELDALAALPRRISR